MRANKKLKVALMWHMHQPDYRDLATGIYQQPWVYLHTIKDYIDMAMHLESQPQAKVVVNITPILLEQIQDYADHLVDYFQNNTPLRDPLLAALASSTIPPSESQRLDIIHWCSRAHKENTIQRFPAYDRLINIWEKVKEGPDGTAYLNDQYFVDILVWYHLGWMAEHVRRSDIRIKRLLEKECQFDLHDRQILLKVISELLNSTIPRYRALAESKQVELSTTPYTHPIIPLLLEFDSAREAMQDAPLPKHSHYPGGKERAKWHINKSIAIFEKYFGFAPSGCWPSEGAISKETCELVQQSGFKWIASGGGVFWNSVNHSSRTAQSVQERRAHLPNQLPGQEITCFFRDDNLSDLIGFEYSDWHADDAVANLVRCLEDIVRNDDIDPDSIVSIILDGENAWEHYPHNGYYFLRALYKQLSGHAEFELTTYSDYLAEKNTPAQTLPNMVAGSWVYGTLSTWIGCKDKNIGWDMLCDAKRCYDEVVGSGKISKEILAKAKDQLAVCEGSDWFWWFGDYNSAESVSDFEKLYRHNLSNLYHLLDYPLPEYLSSSFTYGKGSPEGGGSMRRGGVHN